MSTDSQRRPVRDRPASVADVGVGRVVRRIGAQLRKMLLRRRMGRRWETTDQGLARRVYPDYETYLLHQRTKLDAARASFLIGHDARFYEALSRRLADLPFQLKGKSVLCLAARQGSEVRAFIDHGAFAVGIDLNPGRDNRYVVVGDFHALQYGDATVDIVYTNSLDHAFDPDRMLAEVRRVLAPDGRFMVELGTASGTAGFYESLSWSSIDDMVARIVAGGFHIELRTLFKLPWEGEQVVFSS